MAKFSFVSGVVCALALSTVGLLTTAAQAGTVTLSSSDGSLNMTGEFVSFDDGNYTIRTSLGDMVLSVDAVSCAGESCPDLTPQLITADVVFRGSNSIGEGLMPLLLAGYAASLEASIDSEQAIDGSIISTLIAEDGYGETIGTYLVNSSSTGTAFVALSAETAESADFGMAARRILRPEARALSDEGAGRMTSPAQEHIVAVDNLIVITHPSNPVSSISFKDLARVYRGEINNWSELGGNDMPIAVYSRPESSGTRAIFENRVMGEQGLLQVARILQGNAETAARINANPAAIGYVAYAFLHGAQAMSLIAECGILSTADAFSAKTEEYPLGLRMYLYNRGDALSEGAGEFLEYATSIEADGVVSKAGFIDLSVERRSQVTSQNHMRDRIAGTTDQFELGLMRELLVEMFQWDRLSTTFRFASGSDRLERKSELDMIRLTDFLSTQPDGTEVALVGFTDNDGAFSANQSLSVERAQQVQVAINEFAGDRLSHINFVPLGFGELSPAACNDSNAGKKINRRVEVWIQAAN